MIAAAVAIVVVYDTAFWAIDAKLKDRSVERAKTKEQSKKVNNEDK